MLALDSGPLDAELTLELALCGLLHNSLDLIVGSTFLETAGQVNNGNVGGWNTHRHSSKLAVELWDDLSDCLCGAGAAGDDVLGSSASSTPILGRGTINGLLGGGVGVDGGHETLDETEVIVDDLSKRGQAVGGARGVGKNVDVRLVGLVVDTHNEHGGIRGRSGDDDLLSTTLQVGRGLLSGGKDTSGLNNVGGASLRPGDSSGVPLGVEADLLAVDNEVLAIDGDVTLELTVLRVILEHVGL